MIDRYRWWKMNEDCLTTETLFILFLLLLCDQHFFHHPHQIQIQIPHGREQKEDEVKNWKIPTNWYPEVFILSRVKQDGEKQATLNATTGIKHSSVDESWINKSESGKREPDSLRSYYLPTHMNDLSPLHTIIILNGAAPNSKLFNINPLTAPLWPSLRIFFPNQLESLADSFMIGTNTRPAPVLC